MDKKESRFMGLVGFECPLSIENKLLLEKENFYLKPCICLKSKNVNIQSEDAAGKNFLNLSILHFQMRKWTENELTSPYKIQPPSSQDKPPAIKNILISPKNPKFKNSNSPLTLVGGCTL